MMARFTRKTDSSQPVPEVLEAQPRVQRYVLSGISVLVIGAGVGGLTAALECYRKGHNVRIFERESSITTAGDMFSIGLSGRRWISNWPELQKEFIEASPKVSVTTIHKHTGEVVVKKAAMGKLDGDEEEPMSIQLRSTFHRILYKQVRKLDIEIVYNKRAIDFTEDDARAYVLTDDGQRASADIIIAADGIGSKAQNIVNGGKVEAKRSGTSMYRASCPPELAMGDPNVLKTFGLDDNQDAKVQVWMGPNTHAVIFVQRHIITWAIHYQEAHGSIAGEESWRNETDPCVVLQTMSLTPGWGEGFRALVRATPAPNILHWPLTWRNPSPIWHSPQARIIQVGDSAHSFLPTSGNGATQAIEDSVSLASCLQLAASSDSRLLPSSTVALAVKAHNKLRFERVSCAQKLGFYNAFRYHNTDWDGAKKEPRKAQPEIPQWIWRHNPEVYAEERWDEVSSWVKRGCQRDEISFKNTNTPPGYTWKAWTIEGFMAEGKHSQVELDGDWS